MATVIAKSPSALDWAYKRKHSEAYKRQFYPSILEQYQRVDRALTNIISKAYFASVSTCKMNKLFIDLGLEDIDRSFVSHCAAKIAEEVEVVSQRLVSCRCILNKAAGYG